MTISTASALVCVLDNASWSSSNTNTDIRGLCRPGAKSQRTKRQGSLTGKFYGDSTTGFVASDMDLTAISLGGVSLLGQLYSFTMGGSYDKQPLPAIGVSGMAEGVTGVNFNGSIELQIDDTDVAQALVIAAEAASSAGAQMVFSFTLNGVTVAFPVQLDGDTHAFNQAQYQRITIPFISQAPTRGTAFPTTPASLPGSPGLFDWALLAPKANLSFSFVSKATHGLVRAGFLTWDSFTLTVADGAITDFSYGWKTFGDWTTTNNGS